MTEQDQVGTKIVLEKTPEQIEQEKKKERLLRVGKLKISEVGKYFEQAILDQNAIIMPDHLTLISIREILLENAQSALTLSKERTEPYVQGRRFASEPNIPRGIQILIAVLQNLALTNSGAKPEQFIKDNLDQ